jgi:hypothetical protein
MSVFGANGAEKVKIQVGVHFKPQVPNTIIDSTQHGDNIKESQLDPTAASMTLFSLCDRDFLKKSNKRKPHLIDYGSSKVNKVHKKNFVHKPNFNDSSKKETGPQVEIVDGKIVLKESSLLISGPEATVMEGDYEEVEEDMHAMSKYSSFMDKRKSSAWGIEETRLFYGALRQCGTEFSLMQTFFPSRTRRELKNKFIREENQHPELVKRTMDATVPLELTPFEIMLGEKLVVGSGPINVLVSE